MIWQVADTVTVTLVVQPAAGESLMHLNYCIYPRLAIRKCLVSGYSFDIPILKSNVVLGFD